MLDLRGDRLGVTVEINICRLKHTKWSVEVVDTDNNSIVWQGEFATDDNAHAGFPRSVGTESVPLGNGAAGARLGQSPGVPRISRLILWERDMRRRACYPDVTPSEFIKIANSQPIALNL